MKNGIKVKAKPFSGLITLFHLFLDDQPEEFSGLDSYITKEPKCKEDIDNAQIAQTLKEQLMSMESKQASEEVSKKKQFNTVKINKADKKVRLTSKENIDNFNKTRE